MPKKHRSANKSNESLNMLEKDSEKFPLATEATPEPELTPDVEPAPEPLTVLEEPPAPATYVAESNNNVNQGVIVTDSFGRSMHIYIPKN